MKLDGREFQAIDNAVTAAQNDYTIGNLRAAGALEVLAGLNPQKRDADSISKPANDYLTRIFLTGRKGFILAGLLTEVGKTWTRAEADRNAARFDQITDLDEIQTMAAILSELVITFFQRAGTSSPSFTKSSTPTDADRATNTAELASSESSIH
jgi:hypothetical protein